LVRGFIPIVIAASLALTSCSPKSIPAGACLADSRLAFWLGDTTRWFFVKTTARPWSVTVYEVSVGPAWETRVPYDLVEDWSHTYQPKRGLIVYGAVYPGWELPTKAQTLKPGRKYFVEIWTDGGRALFDLVPGSPMPQCSRSMS